MKKKTTVMTLLLATVLLLSSATAVLAEEYDYPGKELWTDSSWFGGYMTYASLVERNAEGNFDIESMINSQQGQHIIQVLQGTFKYNGYNDPATYEYWAEQGIIKQAFHEDNQEELYTAFAPKYVMEDGNTTLYPLVIVFHGGGRNLQDAEFYGFTALCSREGFLVACPETEDYDHAAQFVMNITNELENEGWPIDRSRIYLVGHSNGGRAAMSGGAAIPELVAAIAPMGALRRFAHEPVNTLLDQHDMLYMPIYSIVGQFDRDHVPVLKNPNDGVEYSFDSETLFQNINKWLIKNGCEYQLDLEECWEAMQNQEDEVVAFFGLHGDNNRIEKVDGRNHYIADFINEDGVVMMRMEAVENLPHWVSGSYAERAWNFLKHFSRGTEGESIYTE